MLIHRYLEDVFFVEGATFPSSVPEPLLETPSQQGEWFWPEVLGIMWITVLVKGCLQDCAL